MIQTSCSIFLEEFAKSGILSVAYYSHLIPAAITVILGLFVLFRTRFSLASKVFFLLSASFSLWLIGDVVLWTTSDYHIIATVWSVLDYINIVFYLSGAYFFIVLVRERDITLWQKIGMFVLTLPAWYVTVTNKTIPAFNEPFCEAFNNSFLTNYKLGLEIAVVLFIIGFSIYHFRKSAKAKRGRIVTVALALLLFFATFSITEFIASTTGVYEINLYGLFVLPLFLGLIIYSITNLQIFQLRTFATQLVIYVLLIMVGSQFFFLQNTTDKALTVVTFLMSLVFCYILIKSIQREAAARKRIETLAKELEKSNASLNEANERLKGLDKLKTEFLSLASHQLRSPLTAIKGYASMLDEGGFGKLTAEQDGAVKRVYSSAQGLVSLVEDLLNVSKIEQGGMKYEFMPTDLSKVVSDLVGEMKIPAETKKLDFRAVIPKYDTFTVNADPVKIKQVLLNLVDNSLKYTEKGFVEVGIGRGENTVVFYVKDSGIGLSPDTKTKLFQKFSRGGEGAKINTGGSGLGLYLAAEIVKAHKGEIKVESDGLGKGSMFSVILPNGFKTNTFNRPS